MLHHHCVTADPQWACNVFSRVICGCSQSRATLDVSHGHFRVGYKSAGLILDGAYNAARILLGKAKTGKCKDNEKPTDGNSSSSTCDPPVSEQPPRQRVLRITAGGSSHS